MNDTLPSAAKVAIVTGIGKAATRLPFIGRG